MKTVWIMTIVSCVLLMTAVGCNENQRMTAWALSGQETDLDVRGGILDELTNVGGTEVGFTVKYARTNDIPWGPEPDVIGGYLIFHLTQDVTIEDTPQASPLQDWLEALHARPYAGVELVGPIDGHQRKVQPNWILGSKFTLSEDSDWALVAEYLDGDQADGDVSVGGMFKF